MGHDPFLSSALDSKPSVLFYYLNGYEGMEFNRAWLVPCEVLTPADIHMIRGLYSWSSRCGGVLERPPALSSPSFYQDITQRFYDLVRRCDDSRFPVAEVNKAIAGTWKKYEVECPLVSRWIVAFIEVFGIEPTGEDEESLELRS